MPISTENNLPENLLSLSPHQLLTHLLLITGADAMHPNDFMEMMSWSETGKYPEREEMLYKFFVRLLEYGYLNRPVLEKNIYSTFDDLKIDAILELTKFLQHPEKDLLRVLAKIKPDCQRLVRIFLDTFFRKENPENLIAKSIHTYIQNNPDDPIALFWTLLITDNVMSLDLKKIASAIESTKDNNDGCHEFVKLYFDQINAAISHVSPKFTPQGDMFFYVNLSGANLSGQSFQGMRFVFSNLAGANLSNIKMSGDLWYLKGNNLHTLVALGNNEVSLFANVNLINADLSNSYFTGTSFENVNFSGANLTGTVFDNVIFKNVKFFTGVNISDPASLTAELDKYHQMLARDPRNTAIFKAIAENLASLIEYSLLSYKKENALFDLAYRHPLFQQQQHYFNVEDTLVNGVNNLYRLFAKSKEPLIETSAQEVLRKTQMKHG